RASRTRRSWRTFWPTPRSRSGCCPCPDPPTGSRRHGIHLRIALPLPWPAQRHKQSPRNRQGAARLCPPYRPARQRSPRLGSPAAAATSVDLPAVAPAGWGPGAEHPAQQDAPPEVVDVVHVVVDELRPDGEPATLTYGPLEQLVVLDQGAVPLKPREEPADQPRPLGGRR